MQRNARKVFGSLYKLKVASVLLAVVVLTLLVFALQKTLKGPQDEKNTSAALQTTIDKIVGRCKDNDNYVKCYKKQFGELSKVYDLPYLQHVLTVLWSIDERTRSCHALAHTIALAQVEKTASSWSQMLGTIDPQACSGGFFHGILEGHARFDPTFELTKSYIESLCGNKDNKYSEGSCIHIFGHLLLVESNGDIAKATAICNSLMLSSNDQCYSGVFMENMTKENLSVHGLATQSKWTQASLPTFEELCLGYKGKAANGCWGEMGHMYAAVYNDDPQIVFDSCERALQKEFSTNCYLHAVTKMSVTSNSQSNVNGICKSYEGSTLFDTCVNRLIDALLKASPRFYERGEKFCQSLSSESQINCFENLKHKKLSEKL